jgi:hypothetical protein
LGNLNNSHLQISLANKQVHYLASKQLPQVLHLVLVTPLIHLPLVLVALVLKTQIQIKHKPLEDYLAKIQTLNHLQTLSVQLIQLNHLKDLVVSVNKLRPLLSPSDNSQLVLVLLVQGKEYLVQSLVSLQLSLQHQQVV